MDLAPSEEILSGRTVGEDESNNQGRNGLTVIPGGESNKLKSLKGHSERGRPESEISEKEILRRTKKILDSIEVHHREWSDGRTRKYSTIKTKVIAGRLPVGLLNEIHRFKGSDTYHLEKALRLYVQIMKETV